MPVPKVLIVDPNQGTRAALSKALTDAGYDVAVAPSGSVAVSALDWECPDLVVSYADVQDMDGYELFTLVRKDPTTMGTPFLLLAGQDRPIALATAEAGANVVLTGAPSIEMVVGRVRDLLKHTTGEDLAQPASVVEVAGPRGSGEPLWAALATVGPRSATGPIGAAFRGSLCVMDLAEVTQAIALGGKTGSLVVSLAAGDGAILFDSGRVIHATFHEQTGEQAFAAIVSASRREADASFCFNRLDRPEVADGPRTISRSAEQLLLSIAVGIDEGEAGAGALEDASPAHRADG